MSVSQTAERRLPKELLERASVRGNEYAWSVADIPKVIDAAQKAGLVSIGGQLQFRLRDGGTCECYWVEVDTDKTMPSALSWDDRVARSAEIAAADFERLKAQYDFLEEGRRGFSGHLEEAEKRGEDLSEAMCFVWYVMSVDEARSLVAVVPSYKFERGPTFLLSLDMAGLRWLRDRFLAVADAKDGAAFVLGDGLPIASDGLCKFVVRVSGDAGGDRIQRNSDTEFTWRVTRENIADIAEKLHALAVSDKPGHQYFGTRGGPYQTVVVTKGEEPVDLVRAMRDGRPGPATQP